VKALNIIARTVGLIAFWAIMIAVLGFALQAPDWYSNHYIGRMPLRWLEGCVLIGSYLGMIVLISAAVFVSVLLIAWPFRAQPPAPEVSPEA
jgi:RsiW-degrading membrane proteinase PrsW (M82 family)